MICVDIYTNYHLVSLSMAPNHNSTVVSMAYLAPTTVGDEREGSTAAAVGARSAGTTQTLISLSSVTFLDVVLRIGGTGAERTGLEGGVLSLPPSLFDITQTYRPRRGKH